MRIGSVIIVVWLIIGAIAAGQRHYYSSSDPNCARAGTIIVTVLAGPLNYTGVNPKIHAKHRSQASDLEVTPLFRLRHEGWRS